jgi:hypothetical protein
MTAEMIKNWLQEARTEACPHFVAGLFQSCTKKLFPTGINFVYSEISRLHAELSNKRAVHIRSHAVALCSILLTKCLPESKCIFVHLISPQKDRSRLPYARVGGDRQRWVVFCDSEIWGIRFTNYVFRHCCHLQGP